MAAKSKQTKRKASTKSAGAAKRKNTTQKERERHERSMRQVWAIILFALGLFLTALALVDGQNVWLFFHKVLFGVFGATAYFVGAILIYVAVMATLDRPYGKVVHKLWQILVFILLICGLVQLFSVGGYGSEGFWKTLVQLYEDGVVRRSGGLASAFIGWPLFALFGKVGAIVTMFLGIFVFLMLISGTTLLGLFHGVSKPAKNVHHAVKTYSERRAQEKAEERERRFNIDVDLGPDFKDERCGFPEDVALPSHPVAVEKPEEEEPPAFSFFKKEKEKKAEVPPVPLEAPKELDTLVEKAASLTEEENAAVGKELDSGLAESTGYKFPPLTLLKASVNLKNEDVSTELQQNSQRLVDTLKSFGVQTRVIDVSRGPSVTRYELQPQAGVKISKITSLADDIALNLAAAGVRIEAPIPNKAAVGIEVPNKNVSVVNIREIVESDTFKRAQSPLTMALGKDIAGNIAVADIAKMPHLLIAGATGSGKSVCINSIIISLLYKSSPDDVRFLMVDPKVVELGGYNGIPHLLVPVVTDPRKASGALNWAVNEMLKRYKLFADNNVRDLKGFNALAAKEDNELQKMPQIVIIIDELADLMMAAPNEVEDAICRLAQMARAAGMHLIIATQRPSVDVITGVIKANIPSRIAFAVSSQVDSRTILDGGGAEKLLGRGDMLFYPVGAAKPTRVQGCFVSDGEVERVVDFIKNKESAEYDESILEEIEKNAAADSKGGGGGDSAGDEDDMLSDAIACVVEAGSASTSFLQRRLKLGYARAARLIDAMEERGIVGPFEGSKPRQVLITRQQWIEMNLNHTEE